MVANSAYKDVYSEDRISYKKTLVGVIETFEYSTNPSDEHYIVSFTNVGANKGDYQLERTIAIGNIYKYVGPNLGSFHPITQLIAPSKSQVFAFNATFKSKKTTLFSEFALSNNDANLFSTIDDTNNKGLASKLNWKQLLLDTDWKLTTDLGYEFLHQNFRSVQRFQTVEFNRDWNLENPLGNRNVLNFSINLKDNKKSSYQYGFYLMNYTENYNGTKHLFNSKTHFNNTFINTNISLLNNTTNTNNNHFLRAKGKIEHSFNNAWLGGFVSTEKTN